MYTPIYRIALVREGRQSLPARWIQSSEDMASIFRDYLKDADRETFVVAGLSVKCTLIGINTVSVGTLDMTVIHPREVFKPAIMMNSAAIIVGHNHPSGDPEPSPEDRRVTDRLVQAGMIIGIEVFDHLIIGEDSFVSLRERGVIDAANDAAKKRAEERRSKSSVRPHGPGGCDADNQAQSPSMVCDGTTKSELHYHRSPDGALNIFDVEMARRIAAEQRRRLVFPVEMLEIAAVNVDELYHKIDHHYAMTADLDQPLLFAPWGEEWLLIDGWDRIYKASRLQVPELPMYLLSEHEASTICVFAEPDRCDQD